MKKTFHFLGILYLFSFLTFSPAFGVVLADPRTGFTSDLDFPRTPVCILYPPSLHKDGDCIGIALNVPEAKGVDLLGMGVLRDARYGVIFMDTAYSVPSAEPVNEAIAQQMLKGYLASFSQQAGGRPVSQVEAGLAMVKGRPVYRYFGEMDLGDSRHLGLLVYCFSGKDNRFIVSLITSTTPDKDLQALGARLIGQIDVPAPTGTPGSEESYRVGYKIGLFIVPILLFVAVAWVIVWAVLSFVKKKGEGKG